MKLCNLCALVRLLRMPQLQMLEENVDYKKKYYEIYSIFLELQAIAEKSIPSDASDTPELNPTEAMAMLYGMLANDLFWCPNCVQ